MNGTVMIQTKKSYIDLGSWTNRIYFVRVLEENKVVFQTKIIKIN